MSTVDLIVDNDQSPRFRKIFSKFPGKCGKCGRHHETLEPIHWSPLFGVFCRWCFDPSLPKPPQEEPMAEPAPISDSVPTAEETKWASFIMNEQRHKRPVTAEDRTKAGQIMGQLRRAQGRTGGGSKPKASPLVVARAIKDIDTKVAEAQGINASREGDVVPAPPLFFSEKPIGTPIPTAEDVGEAVARRHQTTVERIPTAEEAFRASGIKLVEDMDRALEALRSEQLALAERINQTRNRITALGQRRDAIIAAIDVANGAGQ